MHKKEEAMLKRLQLTIVLMLAGLMVYPLMATAGSVTKMIPQQKVSVLKDGKQINQFQSEMPMPEGQLLMSKGPCLIQGSDMQLIARDQSVFALVERPGSKDLTVKKGRVDFAFKPGNKAIAINTPFDSLQVKRTINTASTSGPAKGYVQVSQDNAHLAMTQGSVDVITQKGKIRQIDSGQTITLAQAEVEGGATADEAAGGGLSTAQTAGIVAVGALTVGYSGWAISEANDDDGDEVSPASP